MTRDEKIIAERGYPEATRDEIRASFNRGKYYARNGMDWSMPGRVPSHPVLLKAYRMGIRAGKKA